MSIHRHDRPDAPYRIRKSDFGPRWTWTHLGCNGRRFEGGRAPSRLQAASLAAVHATTEHGASLDHLRSLMPALRAMGVFAGEVTPITD